MKEESFSISYVNENPQVHTIERLRQGYETKEIIKLTGYEEVKTDYKWYIISDDFSNGFCSVHQYSHSNLVYRVRCDEIIFTGEFYVKPPVDSKIKNPRKNPIS